MTALEVANYFVYVLCDAVNDLTNEKVNLLVYFAQGHYLRRHGTPLFDEPIEAWECGPIIHNVFEHYEKFGRKSIDEYDEESLLNIPLDTEHFLYCIASVYGKDFVGTLRGMACVTGTPWYNAFLRCPHSEITQESMKDYYRKKCCEIFRAEAKAG